MPTFSSVTVVTPPVREPVLLDQVKQHLRVDHNDEDVAIKGYMAAAREWIEAFLNQALAETQYLWITASAPYVGAAPFVALPFAIQVNPLWFPWPDVTNQPTNLPRTPVVSVDSVSYGRWGQADTVIDPSRYQADVALGRLRFLYGSLPSGNDHLAVLFTAGHADPKTIPQSILLGLLMMTAHFYENRGDGPMEEPAAIKRLLSMHRRLSFGG